VALDICFLLFDPEPQIYPRTQRGGAADLRWSAGSRFPARNGRLLLWRRCRAPARGLGKGADRDLRLLVA
jgi:hypothetical protein